MILMMKVIMIVIIIMLIIMIMIMIRVMITGVWGREIVECFGRLWNVTGGCGMLR